MSPLPPRYAWVDGTIVHWNEARLHVDTGCVLGGLNVYEVVAAFWSPTADDLLLFRLDEHLRRLERSAKVMRLQIPYTSAELAEAAFDLLSRNEFRQDVLLRIVCYFGEGILFGYLPEEVKTGVFMIAKPVPDTLPYRRGIHLGTSIWNRLPDTVAPARIKAGANYQNARLAHIQARVDGYDDAIIRNINGKIAELPLANIFLYRQGKLATPLPSAGILEGITRQTILELCQEDLLIAVEERDVDHSEIYLADEVFVCGTGREMWPVLSIDHYPIADGKIGPVTQRIQSHLQEVVRGGEQRRRAWCTPVSRRRSPTPGQT